MAQHILITGSTGTVGRALLKELSKSQEPVRAATRNPPGEPAPDGASWVRFDPTEKSTFDLALDGVDRVFLLTPGADFTPDQTFSAFVERLIERRAKVVVMTAAGTEMSDEIPLRKLELQVERSGVPFVILRPNWFMDNFHSYWLQMIRERASIALPAGDGRSSFIDVRDIAATAAGVLTSNRFNGRALTLTGPASLTYSEAASVLSGASGKEIRYQALSNEEFLSAMTSAGFSPEYGNHLVELFDLVRQGHHAEVTQIVQEVTGSAPRSLEAYAKDYATAWQ